MKEFCGLFVAVLVGLALPLLSSADDADGSSCTASFEVNSVPFEETVETFDYPVHFVQFDEYERFEVKGKWYHIKGENKVVKASTCDEETNFTTFIAVYNQCNQTTSGYYYDDLTHSDKCSLKFFAVDGADYFIIIGGRRKDNETFNEGTLSVDFSISTAPAEHHCENPIQITSLPFTNEAVTVASEPVVDSCDGEKHSGIWYHFVGTGKDITATTCGDTTDFDTVISIHSSCDSSSNESCVAFNDDSCGLGSSITFSSVEGQEYFIFVSGSTIHRGSFLLQVMELSFNEHGYCNESIEVDTIPFVYHGSTKMIPVIHSDCEGVDRRGLWFHIGKVTTELMALTCDDNAGFSDTNIDVYSGCNEKVGENCVAFNDDYCGLNAAVILHPSESGYYIYVSGLSNDFEGQNFTLTIQNNHNQTNDRCWQAIRIHSLPVDFSGNTKEMEALSPNHCSAGTGPRHGAWYYYMNRGNKKRMIGATTCNAENVIHSTIEVFSNCEACEANGLYNSTIGCSSVSFNAEPNVNYSIFVSAAEGEEDGFFHIDFYEDEPSPNQHCDAPVEAKSLPFIATGFSSKSNPSYTSCDGGKEYQGLWYLIHGTGKKVRAATVDGSTHYDSMLELHSGCPSLGGPDTCLLMNDDSSHQGLASSLEWDSEEGTDYFLFVRGFGNATGLFSLNIYEITEPSNSKCADALDLAVGTPVLGYTAFASASQGDCVDVPRQGIWYKLKPASSERVTLSTCDSATEFTTDIEIYQNCADSAASGCVDHEHDFRCSKGTIISFIPEANKEYLVFVTGNRTDINQTGFFRLVAWIREKNHTSSSLPASSFTPVVHSSSGHGMEIVEVFLVIFAIALVIAIVFTIVCCFYKRNKKPASYFQMDVPDGLDAQTSTYVAPGITPEGKE